jgi:hypothetical protein
MVQIGLAGHEHHSRGENQKQQDHEEDAKSTNCDEEVARPVRTLRHRRQPVLQFFVGWKQLKKLKSEVR